MCGEGGGRNCVVDGDTFVLNGKAVRVADIDTPEAGNPKCRREAELAEKATRRLRDLLNAGPLDLVAQPRDEDIYGRKLRTVMRDGRSIGDTLIAEGLARRWTGSKKSWCL
ncbi:MAG: thermonuclease family protein [Mesorhizobium sp.]|nr:thermonuclease family protein [Mesorhizobium sp.]